jgi:hypothetical protein
MNPSRTLYAGVIAALVATTSPADATTVKHLDLDKMTASAARVFRGTVVAIKPGSVAAGGGQVPTTTYRLRVVEAFKGTFPTTKDNVAYAEITMVGSPKVSTLRGNLVRLDTFRDMPRLERGQDYLLFLTADSRVRLTSPVGLAQGCFDIDTASPSEPTANRVGNRGLVPGVKGPLPYDDLAARVRTLVESQKGGK